MLKGVDVLQFKNFKDPHGSLIAIENLQDTVPFDIKRIFYIFDVNKDALRGNHANKKSKFCLICLNGKCDIRLNDGSNEELMTLSDPTKGLILDKLIWKDMFNFSEGTVLLALSNETYDSTEYIRDFEEYKELMKETPPVQERMEA